MINVIILAGGLCTRFEKLKVFPKILLPTSTSDSVLNSDIENFSKSNKNINYYLVINEIFYDKESNLAGSVGVKNLADTLKMTDKEFDEYLNDL